MRERIIAGNWKMNSSLFEGVKLARSVVEAVRGIEGVTVVICPPATHLVTIGKVIDGTGVGLGAQNVHWEEKGAFTGELSTGMLENAYCRWVIIGHSERRAMFGETDLTVNKRLLKAVDSQLRPMVCIGEILDDRKAGRTFEIIETQLRTGLRDVPLKGRGGLVIAYEPVWAIGTGQTATPEQAQEAHRFIRDVLMDMYNAADASETVIQYGGSMNEENAAELMACEDVDGGLIGGASLNAGKFAAIVKAAAM